MAAHVGVAVLCGDLSQVQETDWMGETKMTTRARFEKWAEAQGWSIERCDTGEYRTTSTDAAWGGWLACSDEAEVRHSLACAEWSSICRSGRRHGAAVGANECANLLRGWRKNNEPLPLEPLNVRFNAMYTAKPAL